MSAPQGLITFPGIQQVISASMTLGHGIAPSVARLSIAPQAAFPFETGTLEFTMNGTSVAFPNCKLDRSTLVRNTRSEVMELTILDRRWKWRFGQISGKFNVRRDDSTIQKGDGGSPAALVADTERTPRQLAELYLAAMGEIGYDVSALPNDTRPAVDHDFDNPADALADLCDALACRIVLRLDNSVRIVRVGEGGNLAPEFVMESSLAVNVPELPDHIAVVCGPSVFQVDFPLEAVGLDVSPDGTEGETIKPIDQLSYTPNGGWSAADLPYFTSLGTQSAGDDRSGLRGLAVKSVFRYYRIMTPVKIPGYEPDDGQVARREQILPLFEEQVRMTLENAARAPLAAAVFGVWYPSLDEQANTQDVLTPQGDFPPTSGDGQVLKSPFYERGFTIDAARGLVIFNEPVFKNATPDAAKATPAPAQLVLRAKCNVRDAETLALARHTRERATGGSLGTATRYIRREELLLTHVPTYDPASYGSFPAGGVDPRVVTAVATNLDDVNDACDSVIDAALEEYNQPTPWQWKAPNILPTELDGAIVQVTYEVGTSGATTFVARNCEPARFAVGYRQRRRGDHARLAADEAQRSRSPASARRIRRESAAGRRAR